MPSRPVRQTDPRRWRNLVLTGAALGTAMAGAAQAQVAIPRIEAGAGLWLAAGEGGEGGASVTASPEAAYLIELGKLEAHLLAAARLYRVGAFDEAAALAAHPEAEFMDALRARLDAAGVEDTVSDATDAFVEALGARVGAEQVSQALATALEAIRTAEARGPGDLRPRFDAITALAQDAAAEFEHGVENGRIADAVAVQEARGFLDAARALAAPMAGDGGTVDKVLALIDAAVAEAFADGAAPDTTILYGAAARIEFVGLSVR